MSIDADGVIFARNPERIVTQITVLDRMKMDFGAKKNGMVVIDEFIGGENED